MRKFIFLLITWVCVGKTVCQCTNSFEPNENTSSATNFFGFNLFSSPVSSSKNSLITPGDQDWYLIGIDGPGILSIDLTNLPDDYDIDLYGINGLSSYIDESIVSGTTSEHIISNWFVFGSTVRYVKVYGKTPSNYNYISCYKLTISWTPCTIFNTTPSLLSPGTPTSPGTTISTLTPKLDWADVSGATSYGVYVRDMVTNNLVYENACATSISELTLPAGTLVTSRTYRWNVKANYNCGSCVSLIPAAYYFTTSASCTPVSITTQPQDQVVNVGSTVNFSVNVTGTGPYQFSWYKNGFQISGANSSTYTTPAATPQDNGTVYYCRVTNCNGNFQETSSSATLFICSPVTILSQPISQSTICNNQNETLATSAQGTNITYQWQKLNGSSWADVGSNSSTYSTNIEGTYRCVVTGQCGPTQISENAVLINGGSCTGPIAKFTASPTTINAGQQVNFINQSINATSVSWHIERVQTNGATVPYYTTSTNNFPLSFPSPGCYKVVLIASDGTNNNTTVSSNCYIKVNANLNNSVPEYVSYNKNYLTGKGGDPVILSSGSFDMSMKDLFVKGIKTDVVIERRYLSKNSEIGPFGKGWFFEYSTWIDISNPYEWRIHHGDGHISYHVPYQEGETKSLYQGMFDSLYYSINGGVYTYTYQEKSGIKWKYRDDGKLISRVDLDGNTVSCSYTGNNLTSIIAPGGRYINLTYNTQNRIISSIASGGQQVNYYYNPDGTLLDSVNIGSSTTRFKYDGYGLTEVYDPNGNRVIKNIYNSNSQVVEQYDVYENLTSFNYNTPSFLQTTIINPQLKSRVVKHDNNYHLIESIDELNHKRQYTFNSSGLLETVNNELNNKKKLLYDESNNLSKVIDEKNYFDSIDYGIYGRPTYFKDKEGNVLTIIYSITGNPSTVVLPNTGIMQTLYNEQGQDTLTIDGKGNKTRKEYYANGDLYKIIKPGSIITFAHDSQGRLTSVTNGKGYTTNFEYNYFDQITKITDPLGYEKSFGYDLNGNLIYFKDKEDNITLRQYDAKDRLTKLIEPYNHITSFFYDSLNRPEKIRDANGNVKLFTYDNAGKVTKILDSALGTLSMYSYDDVGNIKVITDGRGKEWKINYDERNLPIAYINPLNKQKTLAYNGNGQIIQSTDEAGRYSSWNYNSSGLPFTVTDANGKTVKHYYDLNDNLESLVDAMGNTLRWTYDGDNKIKTYDEGYGIYITAWDSAGNMVSYKDPDNKITDFIYNPNNENTGHKYDGVTLKTFNLSANGWIKEAVNAAGAVKFERDVYGRPLQKIGFYNDTISYKRDSVGNITEVGYGHGKKLSYTYNSLNQSTSVNDWNNNTYSIYRNLNGSIDSLAYPNGNKIKITRDDASRVVIWKIYLNGSSSSLLTMDSLVRNAVGDIIANPSPKLLYPTITETSNNGKYVSADRITVYGTTNFQSGINGNIINANSPQFSNTYNYASNGNSLNGNLIDYTHNGINQTNSFDAFNNRTGIVNKTAFTIDNELAGRPIALSEMNYGGGYIPKALNIYSPEGMLLGRDSVGSMQYPLPDVNGNIIALTNSSSVVTDTYATDPFGDYYTHIGNSNQPFGFLGMYGLQKDSSGLYYDWARYYDAQTGRFLSKDPYPANSLQTQGINSFSYGFNNPMSLIDVNGLYPVNNTSYNDLSFCNINQTIDNFNYSFWGKSQLIWNNSWNQSWKVGMQTISDPKTWSTAFQLVSLIGIPELGVANEGVQAVEGIYEFTAASGETYVGQSGNIAARLEQHIASGKLLPGTSVSTTEILGGKIAREIAEQLRINSLGGIKYLENIRNPIGPARQYLLLKMP